MSTLKNSDLVSELPEFGWALITVVGDDGQLLTHCVPIFDDYEHQFSMQCWCQPREDIVEDSLICHNSHDNREHSEKVGPN